MKFLKLFIILIIGVISCWGRAVIKCKTRNEYKSIKYGEKVKVNGKNMVFGVYGKDNDIPIVLLPGLGVNAPALLYKPFAEALSDKFKVIVIEPFGYGLSDSVKAERNIKNIISEIHTAVHKYGLKKFYLMGHSVGGLYSLGYANKYPEDLLGVIGIDNTPTGLEEVKANEDDVKARGTDCNNKFKDGYWKNITDEEFKMTTNPFDLSYKYSEEELKNYRIIFGYTFCNDNSTDETYHFNSNIDELEGLVFPESIPVLQFVSSANSNYSAGWIPSHEALVSNSTTTNEVILLEGSHFLFIDQKDAMAEKIKSWIN